MRRVKVDPDFPGEMLLHGVLYTAGVEVILTNEQFAAIPQSLFDDSVLDDLGAVVEASSSGTSSAVSATKIASVGIDNDPVVTYAFGAARNVTFTGATIVTGEDYWGVPGSALPLPVTITGDGSVALPDDDAIYDIQCNVSIICDVADAGKVVTASLGGNNSSGSGCTIVQPNGEASMCIPITDQSFVGDSATLNLELGLYSLTVDADANFINLFILKR